MIGVADRQIEPDHVMRERHPRIERRRPGVVAVMSAYPCDAGTPGLRDRGARCRAHHEMADAIVAVDERHAVALALDANVRMEIDAARAYPAHVLRQPKDAVSFRAA